MEFGATRASAKNYSSSSNLFWSLLKNEKILTEKALAYYTYPFTTSFRLYKNKTKKKQKPLFQMFHTQ